MKKLLNKWKRTDAQVAESVKNKDFTGGYKFIPWLIYMRTFFTCTAMPLALFILGSTIYFESKPATTLVTIIILCWSYLISKEYRELKNGISS